MNQGRLHMAEKDRTYESVLLKNHQGIQSYDTLQDLTPSITAAREGRPCGSSERYNFETI